MSRIYEVIVGVALARPPKVDEYRKTLVVADSAVEAQLIACQIAACTSVMPVSSRIETDRKYEYWSQPNG